MYGSNHLTYKNLLANFAAMRIKRLIPYLCTSVGEVRGGREPGGEMKLDALDTVHSPPPPPTTDNHVPFCYSYLCVLSVYMMTKSSMGTVSQHPVVGRLAQYRQLLQVIMELDAGEKD